MDTISNRIRQGLLARNMKQSELVEKTGIGKSSISTYLSGAYEPKQKNIYKIAKALDVSEAWLMGHDVPMDRKPTKIELFAGDSNFELVSIKEKNLLDQYRTLDDLGRHTIDTILRVEFDRCTTNNSSNMLTDIAAHERTDCNITKKDIQHDIDIMTDDDF